MQTTILLTGRAKPMRKRWQRRVPDQQGLWGNSANQTGQDGFFNETEKLTLRIMQPYFPEFLYSLHDNQ